MKINHIHKTLRIQHALVYENIEKPKHQNPNRM